MPRRYAIVDNKIVETEDPKAPVLLYINPDDQERKRLVEEFLIDEHTLGSALDPDEAARLEFEPNHVAFILKRPKNYCGKDQLFFKPATLGLFLFADRLIIVLAEDTTLFEGKAFLRVGTLLDLVLKVVYRSIFHFLEHLKVINLLSDEVEQKINRSMENKYLINLFALQKSLVYYQNAIHSNGGLIEKMRHNAPKLGFTQEELDLLEDTYIENGQCYRQAEVYANILASLMDARAGVVGNNLNVLMKTLNIITIAIMVPTLVVSIFSMNVKLPMPQNSGFWPFWLILGLAGMALGTFLIGWRWINRRK